MTSLQAAGAPQYQALAPTAGAGSPPQQQFTFPVTISIPQQALVPSGQYVFVRTQTPAAVVPVMPSMPSVVEQPVVVASETVEEQEPVAKKSKMWLWLIVGAVVLLVAGLAVFFYFRNKRRAANQQNEVPYTDAELEHLAQTEAEAAAGYMTPVEAAAAAARAGGGSAEDVERAVLAAEQFRPSTVTDEVAQNLTEGHAVQKARHRLHLNR